MANANYYSYTLPSGAVIEIENIPQRERGPREVASRKGKQEPLPFAQVIAPIGEVVEKLFEQVRSAVKSPDHVALELGVALKGGTSLVFVSGETQASLKVTLSWDNRKQRAPD